MVQQGGCGTWCVARAAASTPRQQPPGQRARTLWEPGWTQPLLQLERQMQVEALGFLEEGVECQLGLQGRSSSGGGACSGGTPARTPRSIAGAWTARLVRA